MNNGIAQSGQQWGVDHSPEIDPLAANKLSVIKGVSALSYPGSSLGSVILVEPAPIGNDPHLHGEARYYFESNGLGNGLNLNLKKYSPVLSWSAGGTLKKSGDNSTPTYYLNNTGAEEANAFIMLERDFGKKWKADVYFSSFNARYGILRGAHIGNLTDLAAPLTRDEPFFTEPNFSYAIEAPYQNVNHQLLKAHTRFQISDTHWLDITYGFQLDLRKEFDVRRGGRSEIPALSLEENSQTLELKYRKHFGENWTWNIGNQSTRIDNSNNPETNILPLIPDYIAYESGIFTTLSKNYSQLTIEMGIRYDYIDQRVAAIARTIPREIVRYNNIYHNYAAAAGAQFSLSKDWTMGYNIGLAMRSPEINELYSDGLHQGVGGFEIGDPTLESEQSIKNTLSISGPISKNLNFEALAYYQHIDNFIYLQPLNEFRLTIRGAFPVFEYQQTTAQIIGLDLAATYVLSDNWNIMGQASLIQGDDLDNGLGLVNIPAQSFFGEVNYELPKIGKLENVLFQFNAQVVLQQNNIAIEQDFIPTPAGYQLFGFECSTEFKWKKKRVKFHIELNNLLNTTYRDYLNRQRYFADDIGFNAIFGISLAF
jgi:iron complex outermembrane receptor protein